LQRIVLNLPNPLARETERDREIVERCRLDIPEPETVLDMPMFVGESLSHS
jgi:hypothetical protein